ncbi:S1 RNA-binding domain-containing protein [Patescibacteria group bacterium]|nr:S1 RNA-binding domain-containing protein [Patescibacteria group bacterium]
MTTKDQAGTKTVDEVSSKMEELLATNQSYNIPKVGDLIEGTVISVSKSEVHLDIEGLGTGVIRGGELIDESGDYSDLDNGNKVQATVIELENENRQMELSFRSAGHQKAWDELEQLVKEKKIIEAKVTDANKGGLMVRVKRIEGFLPVSQLTTEHYPRVEGGDKNQILEILSKFINQKFKVRLIDVNESENKLIVSEKAAFEEEQKKVLENYKINTVVEGKISGVVDFGAFIEFGEGLEGLIHISELAWQRIDNPKDIVKVGQEVKAEIINIDDGRVSLSIKKLKEDPWKKAIEKYDIGQTVKGTVLKINPFGAFIELDKDIHGLAHISELAHHKINDPSEIVKVGSDYKFKILSIEPNSHRLGLSMKALSKKPETKEVKVEAKVEVVPAEEVKGEDIKKEPAKPAE